MNLINTRYCSTEEVWGRTSFKECFPKAVIYDLCIGLGKNMVCSGNYSSFPWREHSGQSWRKTSTLKTEESLKDLSEYGQICVCRKRNPARIRRGA